MGKDHVPHIHVHDSTGNKVASVSIPKFGKDDKGNQIITEEPYFLRGDKKLSKKQRKEVFSWLKNPDNAYQAYYIYNSKSDPTENQL